MRSDDEKSKGSPAVLVRMVSHGDFALGLKAYVWSANNINAFALRCDLLYNVKKRFDSEGIEIPFPYRTVVYKKDMNNESV